MTLLDRCGRQSFEDIGVLGDLLVGDDVGREGGAKVDDDAV